MWCTLQVHVMYMFHYIHVHTYIWIYSISHTYVYMYTYKICTYVHLSVELRTYVLEVCRLEWQSSPMHCVPHPGLVATWSSTLVWWPCGPAHTYRHLQQYKCLFTHMYTHTHTHTLWTILQLSQTQVFPQSLVYTSVEDIPPAH